MTINKVLTWTVGAALLVFGLPLSRAEASVANNLIPNPSVELSATARATAPGGWAHNAWGSNQSTFTYVTGDAEDGTHSVKLQVSHYVDGDAKWYFNPVAITAGSTYTYADWYKSTAASEIVAQVQLTDGSFEYLDLGSLARTSSSTNPLGNWVRAARLITMPANAVNVTVFHLLESNGTLQIDNTLLRLVTPADIIDNVPNPSFEELNDITLQPKSWTQGQWGQHKATFSIVAGHTGLRAGQVKVTSYTSGDAKWIYDAQPVIPDATYDFSDWYKATIDTQVVAQVTLTDGTIQYFSLAPATAANAWTKYTSRITMPYNAATVTVLHLIAGVGTLTTDDYSFKQVQPQGFAQGMVSLTFDDGWESFATNAMPILDAAHMHATAYIISGFLDQPQYLTTTEMWAMAADGQEIGDHTVDHPHLTTLTHDQIVHELADSQTALQAFGQPVKNFATPYGEYNDEVISIAKQYFRSQRGVETGFNSADGFDAYDLKVQDVTSTTTEQEISSWVNLAQQQKTWLILVFHQIDNSGAEFSSTPAELQSDVNAISASGISVKTIDQGLDAIGQ